MMWGYGNMGWMWVWAPLLLIGIVLLVLLAVRAFGGGISDRHRSGTGYPPPAGGNRAREILDERFARGELTAEQYREQLRVLGEGR